MPSFLFFFSVPRGIVMPYLVTSVTTAVADARLLVQFTVTLYFSCLCRWNQISQFIYKHFRFIHSKRESHVFAVPQNNFHVTRFFYSRRFHTTQGNMYMNKHAE